MNDTITCSAEPKYAFLIGIADGRWVLSCDMDGHLTLDPTIPQDRAVREIVSACSELLENVHRLNKPTPIRYITLPA